MGGGTVTITNGIYFTWSLGSDGYVRYNYGVQATIVYSDTFDDALDVLNVIPDAVIKIDIGCMYSYGHT